MMWATLVHGVCVVHASRRTPSLQRVRSLLYGWPLVCVAAPVPKPFPFLTVVASQLLNPTAFAALSPGA